MCFTDGSVEELHGGYGYHFIRGEDYLVYSSSAQPEYNQEIELLMGDDILRIDKSAPVATDVALTSVKHMPSGIVSVILPDYPIIGHGVNLKARLCLILSQIIGILTP